MKGLRSILGLTAVAVLLLAMPGHAAPIKYTGELSLRSPIWANQDTLAAAPSSEVSAATLVRRNFEPNLKYLDLAGHIRFTREGSPLALWITGVHSFSRGYFVRESRLKVGLDLKVKNSPLALFSYWERRFDGQDLDRVFVGAKLGFLGRLD